MASAVESETLEWLLALVILGQIIGALVKLSHTGWMGEPAASWEEKLMSLYLPLTLPGLCFLLAFASSWPLIVLDL